jgi:glycosyltransferase involved in cell wall biosynthesis
MNIGVYFNNTQRGPGKVVSNLLKGFDRNNISYHLNSDGGKNIILQSCIRLTNNISNCLLGPNIVTLPIDSVHIMDFEKYESLLVPSYWVKLLYMRWIPESKIKIWAVGIDTDLFSDKSGLNKEYDFLIYFKRRSVVELNGLIAILNSMNKTYTLIEYGNYDELQFINAISKSKYGIIIDNTESQGIAIQEMMSCNLPLIVWDVKYWVDRGEEYRCEATSVPYWDIICGEKFYDISYLPECIQKIENMTYNPREYILRNLSIDISTQNIMNILK